MVVVFFYWTVDVQNKITEIDPEPDVTIEVVGQQWSWTFNYTDEDVANGRNVYEAGQGDYIPTLVLPVDETVQFNLNSPDVIHSFWVTGFLMKMDVIPGRTNRLWLTPTKTGEYVGKCAELCGAYHSRMLFNVRVVTAEEYDQYLQDQIDQGYVSDEPLLGNEYATTQVGRESGENEEGAE
jgi:cytochrome c oxidase subunit 2